MGRISRAVQATRSTVMTTAATGVRAVTRMPIPSALTHQALREARRPQPPSHVQKAHAVEVGMAGRTRTVWLDRHRADQGIVVHLHGGAYVSGPFGSDWSWLSRQIDARGCAGLMIDYRTAPDHVHPIALDDSEAVLRALAAEGRLGAPWVLSGQHAGGGAAFALVRRLARGGGERSVPAPGALIAMAPWLDLELSNSRISETDQADRVHERRLLRDAARRYAGRTPLDDPELSPTNGSLQDLPPLHLSVGRRDFFLTDVRIARLQLEENGVEVTYREVSGKLGLQLVAARGEDVERLHREQAVLIERALSSPR